MAGTLTQAQIDRFWNDGYAFPFDCLSAGEAAEARAKLEAYERTLDDDIHKHLRIKVHLSFLWLWELAHHPKILDAVEDLVGPDILLYLSTLWFKNARDGKYVSWHQDSAYYGLDPHDVVTLWLAFTDSNAGNGCVQVIPGSHKEPDRRHVETYAAGNLLARGQSIEGIDAAKAVKFELRAGQFSMHHERLIHGSEPNRSNDRRLGMSFTYLPTRVRCTLPGRSATLVRGADAYGHWARDPTPRRDLDPVCMEAMRRGIADYADPGIAQEAARAG